MGERLKKEQFVKHSISFLKCEELHAFNDFVKGGFQLIWKKIYVHFTKVALCVTLLKLITKL